MFVADIAKVRTKQQAALFRRMAETNPRLAQIAGGLERLVSQNVIPIFTASASHRTAPASRILSANLSDDAYIEAFLGEFGVRSGGEGEFVDVTGERLVISDRLFRVRSNESRSKLRKEGRQRHVLLLADTIRLPDEIWDEEGDASGRMHRRRRYVAQWRIEGETIPALTVFEVDSDRWEGVTAFSPDLDRRREYLDRHVRLGELVYCRER